MRFTTINSDIIIDDEKELDNIRKGNKKYGLDICVYIEEESCSRHISFNISPSIEVDYDYDIFLDLDIYQAELLGLKILEFVKNRKEFLESKMKEQD